MVNTKITKTRPDKQVHTDDPKPILHIDGQVVGVEYPDVSILEPERLFLRSVSHKKAFDGIKDAPLFFGLSRSKHLFLGFFTYELLDSVGCSDDVCLFALKNNK